MSWQGRQFRRQALRFLARCVPNSRLAEFQVYVGVFRQRCAEGTEGGDRASHWARDVCVIQKCIQVFSRAESGLGVLLVLLLHTATVGVLARAKVSPEEMAMVCRGGVAFILLAPC